MNNNKLPSRMRSLRMACKKWIRLLCLQERMGLGSTVLQTAKKMNKLQPSLAFLSNFENKRFKAFLLERGNVASLHSHHPFGERIPHASQLGLGIHLRSVNFWFYLFPFAILSLIGAPPPPPLKQNSIRWRKQSLFLCSPLTQESVVD